MSNLGYLFKKIDSLTHLPYIYIININIENLMEMRLRIM